MKKVKSTEKAIVLRIAMLFAAALALIPLELHAAFPDDVNGRFYISDYYSYDDDDLDVHVITARLKLHRTLEGANFTFGLDGRVRKKAFNGDFDEHVEKWRVDEAWMGYRFFDKKLEITAGRQDIFELYNTTIDGAKVKYNFGTGFGMGLFGGLAPDKEDESLTTDFRSLGGFVLYSAQENQFYFGYENLEYNGETDREYFSLRALARLSEKVRFNGVSSASINQLTDKLEIENANVNLSYAPSKKLRFNTFGSYFRTIKYYASTADYFVLPEAAESYYLDDNSRTRVGARIDYKLMRTLKVYASAAYEKTKIDDDDKVLLTAGFRKYDLFGFDISGRYTFDNDDSSTRNDFDAEISRFFFRKVNVSIYASHEEKRLNAENAFIERTLRYGANIYWKISKRYYLTAFAEQSDDEGFMTTSFFTQLGYKF